jgi:hypothetical protein
MTFAHPDSTAHNTTAIRTNVSFRMIISIFCTQVQRVGGSFVL